MQPANNTKLPYLLPPSTQNNTQGAAIAPTGRPGARGGGPRERVRVVQVAGAGGGSRQLPQQRYELGVPVLWRLGWVVWWRVVWWSGWWGGGGWRAGVVGELLVMPASTIRPSKSSGQPPATQPPSHPPPFQATTHQFRITRWFSALTGSFPILTTSNRLCTSSDTIDSSSANEKKPQRKVALTTA